MPDSDFKRKLDQKSINHVKRTNPILKKILVKFINYSGRLLFFFKRNKLPEDVKKILFVSLNFNGDILFGSVLFELLQKMYPSSEMHIWIKSRTKNMLNGYPFFKKIHIFDDIRTRRYDEDVKFSLFSKLNFFSTLRKEKFDLAIDLTGYFWTAFALFYSGAKYTTGYNFQGFGSFYNHEVEAIQKNHLIDKHLSIIHSNKAFEKILTPELKKIKIPSFHINIDAKANIEHIFLENNISPELPKLVLHTTAGWKAKKWDISDYSDVINKIDDRIIIFIIGGNEDIKNGNILSSKAKRKIFNFTGKLNINESAELIKRCDLFLGADSGPLYLAESVGVKTLSLFGPTNPVFSAPRGKGHKYLYKQLFCSAPENEQNCLLIAGLNCRTVDCMNLISVNEVVDNIHKILNI